MQGDEAFVRAALYETCKKSKILSNIDLGSLDLQTLQSLINRQNIMTFREFPIILSKYITKTVLQVAKQKYPSLGRYLQPENIAICVESDEMTYLQTTKSAYQPNIYLIVGKNLVSSVLGASISSFKESLLARAGDTANNDVVDGRVESPASIGDKIKVASVSKPIVLPQAPQVYTDGFLSPVVLNDGDKGETCVQVHVDAPKSPNDEEHRRRRTDSVTSLAESYSSYMSEGSSSSMSSSSSLKRKATAEMVANESKRHAAIFATETLADSV